MNYELAFLPSALREWEKLDNSIKAQFKSKLKQRLETPRVASAALHNMPDCYKIKLRRLGFRLVYRVEDSVVTVTVLAVGKRDKNQVYAAAEKRV